MVVRCRDGGEEADFVFRVLARGPRVRVIGTFGGRLVVCGEGVRRVCNNHAYASRDESCLRVVVRLLGSGPSGTLLGSLALSYRCCSWWWLCCSLPAFSALAKPPNYRVASENDGAHLEDAPRPRSPFLLSLFLPFLATCSPQLKPLPLRKRSLVLLPLARTRRERRKGSFGELQLGTRQRRREWGSSWAQTELRVRKIADGER